MILWDKTEEKFGLTEETARQKHKIVVSCDVCGIERDMLYMCYKRTVKRANKYNCHTCATQDDDFKNGCSKRALGLWSTKEYRSRNLNTVQSEEYREKKKQESLVRWRDDEFRSKMITAEKTEERKLSSSISAKKCWQRPEYRVKMSKAISNKMKKQWLDDDYKSYMVKLQATITSGLWHDGVFAECFDEEFCAKMIDVNREINSRPEVKAKLSEAGKLNWEDPEYRYKVIEGNKEKWQNPEYRKKMIEIIRQNLADPEALVKISESSLRCWEDPEYRYKVIEGNKEKWQDPDYREKMATIRSEQANHTSSIQAQLYKYLDDLDVDYHKEGPETRIGYYVFDCLVDNPDGRDLLIECQGDYWHSSDNVQARDRGKFTYIDRYFPEYEIMYIWEHEFYARDRVLQRLQLKLGINIDTVDFNLKDVVLRVVSSRDIRSFLDAYHYIGKGRGGSCFGAFLNDELIGCIVFSSPIRQNTAGQFGLDDNSVRELSRLCIHPLYHKKNFASWFISRTIKEIGSGTIIAYADTTVGHDGTVYKAANFELHHEVMPDYWYVDGDGFVMNKKTLYQRARKMSMRESDFAEKYGYVKKWGGKKLCFVLNKNKL